jgi:hypothetical protein
MNKHLRVITEVRALTYEIDRLHRANAEQSLGMFAAAQGLSELCYPEAIPEDLLTESVTTSLQQLQEYVTNSEELRQHIAIEQGEYTRPYSLHPHEELVQLVDGVSANAYLTYARVSGMRQDSTRQYPGSCSSMFYIMQHELRKQYVETQHMWWFEAGNNHHFLRITLPDGEMIYIDPTWQQYLPKDTDYSQHPNVLIGPTDQITEILTMHGVPESLHRSWLAAKVDPHPENDWWDWSHDLKQVFDNDPWIPALSEHKQRLFLQRNY